MRLRVILGFLARTPRAGPQILETLVGIIDLGADIATKLVEFSSPKVAFMARCLRA